MYKDLVEYVARALVDNPDLRRQAGEQGREWVVRHHHHLTVARMLEAEYAALVKP